MANDQNQQDPFAQAAAPDAPVTRDATERIFGMGVTPGGSLDKALQQHHAERAAQAQMYRKNVADALGQLHYGKNPTTGEDLSEDEISKLTAQKDYALDQYAKLIGVNKDSKGAIEKARSIIDFITGQKKARQGQMAPPPTPQYATTVGDAGVSVNPPVGPPQAVGPTPQYATNVTDRDVTYDPRKAMTPPPLSPKDQARQDAYKQRLSSIESSISAPFNQQGVNFNTALQNKGRTITADVQTRDALVKKVIPEADWNKPYVQDYKLTGNISRGMLSQMKYQKGPLVRDKNGLPVRTLLNPSQDPDVGGLYNPDTLERMEGYTPMSEADLKTNTINLMTPDGPREMFRVGNKVYDNHGVLQDGELVPFSRGMVKTITDREVKGYTADGKPTSYLLRSTRTPDMPGGIPSPVATPPAGPVAPAVGGAPAAKWQGGAPVASGTPKAKGGGTSKFASGGGGDVFPAGQFNQFTKGAVGVDQARSSLLGNNYDKGEVGGLASDLDVFKSPDSVKKIGEYLQLVNNQVANQADAIARHGPVAAAEWYVGLPQAVIGLQQGALREESEKLNPAEQKFVADYFRTMGTMGGMRASTGMPAYEWSFRNMFAEMPTPGPVTDYNEAVRRLMNYVGETNVPAKHNALMEKVDVNEFENKIRGGGGRKSGAAPPPTPGSAPKTAAEYLSKFKKKS